MSNGPFASLWRRAPWWRFSLLCAVLSSLLVALFPGRPLLREGDAVPAVAQGQASYTPQKSAPDAAPVVAQSAPAPVAAPANVPTAPEITNAAPPATARPAPSPPQAAATASQPATAALSLATPANTGGGAADPSGLDPALLGRTYSGSIMVAGIKLPLPPGNWSMLANTTLSPPNSSGRGYFMGRIEKKRLVGAVIVYVLRSTSQPNMGYPLSPACTATSHAAFAVNEGAVAADHQACWLVHTYFTPPWQQWGDRSIKLANLTRAAAGNMSAKGVTYPQDLLAVQFYRAERWGMIDASYLFSPEADGIASNVAATIRDADWFAPNIARFPEKVAYLEKLKSWGRAFWPRVNAAFDEGELHGATTPANAAADPAR